MTKEEIGNTLKQMKNSWVAEIDNLLIDIMKTDSIQTIEMLHKVWNDEEIPEK